MGFKGFTSIASLFFGEIDVTPSPKPATGADGEFTADILVPQSDTGVSTIEVKVGNTTASASFTVTERAVAPTAAPLTAEADSATVFAPIIDNGDNLIGVFQFDNATQTWTSFDPDPDFADFNDLTSVRGGNIVWIRVHNAQDFNGTALVEGWNQIVLP